MKWTIIRVTFIAAVFLSSVIVTPATAQAEDMSAPFLIAAFVFGTIGLLFVVGVQRFNPLSAKLWRYPKWSINPFQMREPLQFFYFGGYFMFALGTGTIFHQVFFGPALRNSDCLPLVFGLGILCGVRACTVAYQNKMIVEDLD